MSDPTKTPRKMQITVVHFQRAVDIDRAGADEAWKVAEHPKVAVAKNSGGVTFTSTTKEDKLRIQTIPWSNIASITEDEVIEKEPTK